MILNFFKQVKIQEKFQKRIRKNFNEQVERNRDIKNYGQKHDKYMAIINREKVISPKNKMIIRLAKSNLDQNIEVQP